MRERTYEQKKGTQNGILRLIFVLISIGFEVWLIMWLMTDLNHRAEGMNIFTRILAVVLVLLIYGQHKTSSMKMPWIILIMAAPVCGVTMYLLVGLNGSTRKMKKRYHDIDERLLQLRLDDTKAQNELRDYDLSIAGISRYIRRYAGYPLYRNTDVIFYDDAEKALEAQLAALKKAKKFIFMEYHAIEDKESWARVESILVQKVKEGVEVRVFYDDMGSIGFINTDFIRKMEGFGIACRVFNPFAPGLNAFLNNRDHRKITVIDGEVGFTGGYNLANEYFNLTHPYGHWKDTGIQVKGEAVYSFTVMFLEMWNAIRDTDKDDPDLSVYLPILDYHAREPESFVIPYSDNPMDEEQTGENVYISMIERAQHYIYFITPYLIITDEMNHAFGMAAKRGVDVRIITPGIPDKKVVWQVTKSYYNGLARNGVRIYEYTPGFCHAKQSVSDDKVATCGTINLDYRSLYHHFEDGCVFANCQAVHDIRADFDALFPQCEEVTERYRTGRSSFLRIGQCFLRLFAELL